MRRRARSPRARLAAALSAGAAVLALAGCGGVPPDDADAEAGRQLFVGGCGQCHVMEDAGTEGRVGPNLDDAFRGARQQGFEESQIHAVTREWIALSQPPMPRDIYEGEEAEDVAAYVAEFAGLSDASQPRAPQGDADEPEAPADGGNGGQGQSGAEAEESGAEESGAEESGEAPAEGAE